MPSRVFTPQEIGPELLRTDKRIQQAAIRGLRLAARLGRGQVVKEIRGNKPFPIVDLKQLVSSPKVTNIPEGAVLEVTATHGIYQEFGTGPAAGNPRFTPPFDVILQWAIRKQRGGPKRKKKTGKKTKKGAGRPASKTRGGAPESPFERARASHTREKTKASRAKTKAKREAAQAKAARRFAGAVWSNMRRFGMKGKNYYARASKHFQRHVDERVADQVAKVDS